MTSEDDLSEALRQAQESWTGCDWDTEFGPKQANLGGLCSRQARLAAAATRGGEAEFWRTASCYLEGVERDAASAACLAALAVALWKNDREIAALDKLDDAIALEAKYRLPIHYPRLREQIQEKTDAR